MTGTTTGHGCGDTTRGAGDITAVSTDLGVSIQLILTTGETRFSMICITPTEHITIRGIHTGTMADTILSTTTTEITDTLHTADIQIHTITIIPTPITNTKTVTEFVEKYTEKG